MTKNNPIRRSVTTMKENGYSIKTIAEHHETSEEAICLLLGLSKSNTSIAYATIHTGNEQDLTGHFYNVATKKWVN